mmetsp:Transcript_212/g.709  ORF Transcript_212/g.709 Transcript_212/m.709 type:complete len:488 (-) Transcript_212:28-1491(-)
MSQQSTPRAVAKGARTQRPSARSAAYPARRRSGAQRSAISRPLKQSRRDVKTTRCAAAPPTQTHYQVLGVAKTASTGELRTAFLKRVLASHPDKGGSADLFRLVVSAFEILQDPAQRQSYDEQLARTGPALARKRERRSVARPIFARIAELLTKMSPRCRKEVITSRFSQRQRVALEAHMKEARAQAIANKDAVVCKLGANDGQKSSRAGTGAAGTQGICRTKQGYFAQVTWNGLSMKGKMRGELKDAVADHIGLLQVMHILKLELPSREKVRECHAADVAEAVVFATRSATAGEQVAAGLDALNVIQVSVNLTYFLGQHPLMLRRKCLGDAVYAWLQLRRSRDQLCLDKGQSTLVGVEGRKLLEEQWQHFKALYIQLEAEQGADPAYLQARLNLWEEEHLPVRRQKDAELACRLAQAPVAGEPLDDATLTRRISFLLAREQGQEGETPKAASVCVKRSRVASRSAESRCKQRRTHFARLGQAARSL